MSIIYINVNPLRSLSTNEHRLVAGYPAGYQGDCAICVEPFVVEREVIVCHDLTLPKVIHIDANGELMANIDATFVGGDANCCIWIGDESGSPFRTRHMAVHYKNGPTEVWRYYSCIVDNSNVVQEDSARGSETNLVWDWENSPLVVEGPLTGFECIDTNAVVDIFLTDISFTAV